MELTIDIFPVIEVRDEYEFFFGVDRVEEAIVTDPIAVNRT
jgi:hypothetical protein